MYLKQGKSNDTSFIKKENGRTKEKGKKLTKNKYAVTPPSRKHFAYLSNDSFSPPPKEQTHTHKIQNLRGPNLLSKEETTRKSEGERETER